MLDVVQEAGLIRKVTKKVYWNSRFVRLRTQIEEEDLIQMVFCKLLYRENYKIYSDNYSLVGFIYRVANGCAISCANKRSNFNEWTILDQPLDDSEDSKALIDYLTSENPNSELDVDLDTRVRINKVAANMDPTEIESVIIRYKDEEHLFSIEGLFDLFIHTGFTKEELRSHVINKRTRKPVTISTFNKWWRALVASAEEALA